MPYVSLVIMHRVYTIIENSSLITTESWDFIQVCWWVKSVYYSEIAPQQGSASWSLLTESHDVSVNALGDALQSTYPNPGRADLMVSTSLLSPWLYHVWVEWGTQVFLCPSPRLLSQLSLVLWRPDPCHRLMNGSLCCLILLWGAVPLLQGHLISF